MKPLYFLLVICWQFPIASPISAQPTQEKWEVKAEDNTLLFRVSGKGLKKYSYIYGTIHDICEEDIMISPTFEKLFKKTKQLYLEVDVDDPKEQLIGRLGLALPPDSSLKDMLSKEEYEYAQKFFSDSLHVSIEKYEGMRPMLLFSVIYGNVHDCMTTIPFEKVLMVRALKQKKEIFGLDKMIDMVRVYDRIPVKNQVDNFLNALHTYNPRAMRTAYREMYEFYKKNDLNGLSRIIFDDEVMSIYVKGLEDIMLLERNKRWLPVMLAAAKDKPTFFAFGAGHLVGEDGMVNLLRKEGYTVEPLQMNN